MANMSYCRFENTLSDLKDCYEHIEDRTLGEREDQCRKRLIQLCNRIASEFNYEEDE